MILCDADSHVRVLGCLWCSRLVASLPEAKRPSKDCVRVCVRVCAGTTPGRTCIIADRLRAHAHTTWPRLELFLESRMLRKGFLAELVPVTPRLRLIAKPSTRCSSAQRQIVRSPIALDRVCARVCVSKCACVLGRGQGCAGRGRVGASAGKWWWAGGLRCVQIEYTVLYGTSSASGPGPSHRAESPPSRPGPGMRT